MVRQVTNVSAIGPVPAQSIKMDLIGGAFEKGRTDGNSQGSQVDIVSYGSCVVTTHVSGQPNPPTNTTAQSLDAGTITVSGPGINGSRQVTKTVVGAPLI